ncbi:D-ribose-binding periplasmic protein precursor [compost metagenome]
MVIQPTDNSALGRGLQEANRLKIPVIAYDQYIVNGDLESYLTSDNYKAGRDNADYVDGLFPRDKNLRIVVFEYPKVSSTTERVDGFFESLRDKSRSFDVLKRYQAVDPTSGAIAAKQFLKDFPGKDSVDIILTVNDGGGITIVKYLWEKKRRDLVHVTFDGDPLSVENISKKKLTVIDSAQFCAELGRETARALIAHIKKEKWPEKKLVPTFPVTSRTWKAYPGWMGRPIVTIPEQLEKPEPMVLPNTKDLGASRLILSIGIAPLCPYICEKAPGVWSGYIYDILKSVGDKRGFSLDIQSIPNTRIIANLKQHKVDYIIVTASLVRYLDSIRIVGPTLGVNHMAALVAPEFKEALIDEEFIKNKKIVFADLGLDIRAISKMLSPDKVSRLTGFDAVDRMINMIGDRRVDLGMGDINVLRYALARKPTVTLQLLPTSLTGFNALVLVALPKSSQPEYLSYFLDEWMTSARSNGELEKILDKYNLKDWRIIN